MANPGNCLIAEEGIGTITQGLCRQRQEVPCITAKLAQCSPKAIVHVNELQILIIDHKSMLDLIYPLGYVLGKESPSGTKSLGLNGT